MKPCGRCRQVKPLDEFYPDRRKRDGRHSICAECVKADRRARYAADPEKYKLRNKVYGASEAGQTGAVRRRNALRDAAHEAYGGRCACCGEAEPAFLTIDHVGGWGAEHRVTPGASNVYQWLKREGYPQDGRIQLLCWNCNCAMGVRGGCPHRGGAPI